MAENLPLYWPLFYCQETKHFFSPPCPECGQLLTECTDESLLTFAGINQVGGYLYCANCHADRPESPLYSETNSREMAPSSSIQSARDLIAQFANLIANTSVADGSVSLPCLSCPEASHCYQQSGQSQEGMYTKALDRIHVLSFLPFHAYFHEYHAFGYSEYLALVSDMDAAYSKGELAGNALPRLFHYSESDKSAYEVLLLKLRVFRQVVEAVAAVQNVLQRPVASLSPKGIAVKPGTGSAEFASLWASQAVLTSLDGLVPGVRANEWLLSDDSSMETEGELPFSVNAANAAVGSAPVTAAGDLYSLGRLWFFTLFYNGDTSGAHRLFQVLDNVGQDLQRAFEAQPINTRPEVVRQAMEEFLLDQFSQQAFVSEQLVRAKTGLKVEILPGLWRRILNFGFRLLSRIPYFSFSTGIGVEAPSASLFSEVLQELTDLEREVKGLLFHLPSGFAQILGAALTSVADSSEENTAPVLRNIERPGVAAQPGSVTTQSAKSTPKDFDPEQTVMIGRQGLESVQSAIETRASSIEQDRRREPAIGGYQQVVDTDELDQTVMLTGRGESEIARVKRQQAQSADPRKEVKDMGRPLDVTTLEETVMIRKPRDE